jgi:hypothetical protein
MHDHIRAADLASKRAKLGDCPIAGEGVRARGAAGL